MSSTPVEQVSLPADEETLGRRGFLKRLSALGALISAGLVSVPVLRAIFSPTIGHAKVDSWVKVADDTALLDIGVPVRVNFVQTVDDAWVESRTLSGVWLNTEDGEKFKAYNGHCTHLGCSYAYDQQRKTFFVRVIAGSSTSRPAKSSRVLLRDHWTSCRSKFATRRSS